MTTKSITEETKQEEIVDDLSHAEVKIETIAKAVEEPVLDVKKMAALKAKMEAKQREISMTAKIVAKKERSIAFGVIGTGQAGSKLAATFHQFGYDTVAINTAMQDLKHIELPDSNKLLIQAGEFGGAAKELTIGHESALSYRGEIAQLINDKLASSQVNIVCSSLGGGSGAGSLEVIIDVLAEIGKPIIVLTVLPMTNEDVQTKHNSIQTLAKLSQYARDKKIANLIVVDNARIESIYSDVSQMSFYQVANKAIVEPLNAFNEISMMPSMSKPLDSTELAKIMIDGEGLTVYGQFDVANYTDEMAISEAVINNLSTNLLAEGFDVKQAKYVGFICVANKSVWDQIPAASFNYANSIVLELAEQPAGVFRGAYIIDMPENVVKVYSIFSGLGLPASRVNQLKEEAKEYMTSVKNKNAQRNLTLELDTGTNETVSAAQKVKDKIAQKNSAFGKMVGNKVIDRRK